jgi:hypothetical protein
VESASLEEGDIERLSQVLAGKNPLTPQGFKNASEHPDCIDWMWRRAARHVAPAYILCAVPTGERVGFDVVDLDPRNGSDSRETGRFLPSTRIHRTRSGGKHVLLAHHPGLHGTSSRIAPGVDLRTSGNYVIWWPAHGLPIVDNSPVADWPEWLLEAARSEDKSGRLGGFHLPAPVSDSRILGYVEAMAERVRTAPDGTKHHTLFRSARAAGGVLAGAGVDDDGYVTEALLKTLRGRDVRSWGGARKTVADGLRCGRKDPIHLAERAGR